MNLKAKRAAMCNETRFQLRESNRTRQTTSYADRMKRETRIIKSSWNWKTGHHSFWLLHNGAIYSSYLMLLPDCCNMPFYYFFIFYFLRNIGWLGSVWCDTFVCARSFTKTWNNQIDRNEFWIRRNATHCNCVARKSTVSSNCVN